MLAVFVHTKCCSSILVIFLACTWNFLPVACDEGGTQITQDGMSSSGNTIGDRNGLDNKISHRSILRYGQRMMDISRLKTPVELDLLIEKSRNNKWKRFDDYGHMRFGKRGVDEQFDDYGHMRFGRSI